MIQYLPLVVLFALVLGFASNSFSASGFLAPRRPTAAKRAPYECGIVPTRAPAERFPVRFYLVAMLFIIFDIEIIFLYPWAVEFNALGKFGLIEMGVFALTVVVAFAYLLSNGALDWGPVSRDIDKSSRTAQSTIRRVPSRHKTERAADATPLEPTA